MAECGKREKEEEEHKQGTQDKVHTVIRIKTHTTHTHMLQKIVFLILFFFCLVFMRNFMIYTHLFIFFLIYSYLYFFSGNVTYFNDVWIYFYWKTRQKYCLTIISCSTCNIHTPSPHKTPFPLLFLSSSCFSFRHSFIIQWRNTGAPASTDSFQKSYSQTRIIPNSTHTHTRTL